MRATNQYTLTLYKQFMEPQIFKNKVVKIVLHYGTSEDYMLEWEELVFVYEDGVEELVSRIKTCADSPEDNSLSRIGSHNLLRIVQAVEINPKIIYEAHDHQDSDGYKFNP